MGGGQLPALCVSGSTTAIPSYLHRIAVVFSGPGGVCAGVSLDGSHIPLVTPQGKSEPPDPGLFPCTVPARASRFHFGVRGRREWGVRQLSRERAE